MNEKLFIVFREYVNRSRFLKDMIAFIDSEREEYGVEPICRVLLNCSVYLRVPPWSAPSVGSTGDSNDNALAESIIGLFKTGGIRRRGPWKNFMTVEFATLEWMNWFNNRRLLEPIGNIPPAEFEQACNDEVKASARVAGLT